MDPANTTPLQPEDWLIGANGVWMGTAANGWRRLGPYTYVTNDIAVDTSTGTFPTGNATPDILVATGHGLWQANGDPTRRWVQLHDETLTEVAVVRPTIDAGVAVAGCYGVARSTPDDLGIPRWQSNTENHVPDERFTNDLLTTSTGPWLAATEAGVLVSGDGGLQWALTDLRDTAVRVLHRVYDGWLAGSDTRGLWHSVDGTHWKAVDAPPSGVFSIATEGDRLLLGGYDGIHIRDATSQWRRSGPRAMICSMAARDGVWLAGADPGGLWVSTDAGGSWRHTGSFNSVRAICEPAASVVPTTTGEL